MTSVRERFEQAASDVLRLPVRPDNPTLLRLYALYKQATVGDVKGAEPGIFDVVGAAKHDAWAELQGMSQAQAKREYAALVEQLAGK